MWKNPHRPISGRFTPLLFAPPENGRVKGRLPNLGKGKGVPGHPGNSPWRPFSRHPGTPPSVLRGGDRATAVLLINTFRDTSAENIYTRMLYRHFMAADDARQSADVELFSEQISAKDIHSTVAQPQQDPVVLLARQVAVLSARVSGCELDLENIRNKVLRREGSTKKVQPKSTWRPQPMVPRG